MIRRKVHTDSDSDAVDAVSFGSGPIYRKCSKSKKWFDRRTGEEVQVKERSFNEILEKSRKCTGCGRPEWVCAKELSNSDAGSNLKFLRREHRLNQFELSEATNIPRWKIQLIESGVKKPTIVELESLRKVLGSELKFSETET